MAGREHKVYRMYDGEEVVYVGITKRDETRIREHERDKPWYPEVDRVEFTENAVPERIARAIERRGISKGTRHNIQHNPRRGES